MRYVIRQCVDPACRFRYPVDEETVGPDALCPRCGAPTRIAVEFSSTQALLSLHEKKDRTPSPHVEALLDNIRSIYNVGSIFRTADGAGVRRLHLCGITPTPEHPKVAKTALGAEQAVPWRAYNNAVDAILALKEEGFIVLALEEGDGAGQKLSFSEKLSFSKPVADQKPGFSKKPGFFSDAPILLMVGNEIAGIDPGVLALADHRLAIPMRGVKRSLNVATAFGIAAYWMTG